MRPPGADPRDPRTGCRLSNTTRRDRPASRGLRPTPAKLMPGGSGGSDSNRGATRVGCTVTTCPRGTLLAGAPTVHTDGEVQDVSRDAGRAAAPSPSVNNPGDSAVPWLWSGGPRRRPSVPDDGPFIGSTQKDDLGSVEGSLWGGTISRDPRPKVGRPRPRSSLPPPIPIGGPGGREFPGGRERFRDRAVMVLAHIERGGDGLGRSGRVTTLGHIPRTMRELAGRGRSDRTEPARNLDAEFTEPRLDARRTLRTRRTVPVPLAEVTDHEVGGDPPNARIRARIGLGTRSPNASCGSPRFRTGQSSELLRQDREIGPRHLVRVGKDEPGPTRERVSGPGLRTPLAHRQPNRIARRLP